MSKELCLLRHAESVPKNFYEEDKMRELSPKGMHEAAQIAEFCENRKLRFDLITCSSAKRTSTTAMVLAEQVGYAEHHIVDADELYEASVRTLLDYVNRLDDRHERVLLIGHNPGISYFAELLTRAEVGDMPPAGLAHIRFETDTWKAVSQGTGELVVFTSPAQLIQE